jgi:RecA-family ATPase
LALGGDVDEGVTLLAGAPKLGKSWLMLNVAVAVASGGKAFGSIDVEQGAVLYLAVDDNGRRLQKRLRGCCRANPGPNA